MRSSTRSPGVWTALALHFVLALLSAYGCIQALQFLLRHAASGMGTQLLFREFIPAVMITISLVGLWRTTRWGWALAVIADGTLCAQFLWFLLNYPNAFIRQPRFLAFSIWQFAGLAVLLYRPVWEHFLGEHSRSNTVPRGPTRSPQSQAGKPLRWVVYFCVAVISTCAVTAFSLAVFMGHKRPGNGGSRGFVLYLYFGLLGGWAASFLFALILTLLARRVGPTRLLPWLLLGGTLAPSLILGLAVIGARLGPGPLNIIFWGPITLFQVWWLTPPTGLITAWICYTMYPWCTSTPAR